MHLFVIFSERSAMNKVYMVIGVLAIAFMVNGQSLSDTSSAGNANTINSITGIREDTLSPANAASKTGGRLNEAKKDTVIIEVQRGRQSASLHNAIAKGKSLTTTGLVLHFGGLGVGMILSLASSGVTSSDAATTFLILDLVTSGMEIVGPIVSCVGASNVKDAAEKDGLETGEFVAWKEYGKGWVYTGSGTGLVLAGALIGGLSSNGDAGAAIIALPIMLTAVAFIIVGEVKFIQCMVHAKIYTGRFDAVARNSSISWNLTPTIDVKGRPGLALCAKF